VGKMIRIAEKNDIEDGKIKEFTLEGKQIAIANNDGDYFAFDSSCTHAQCSLAGGFLEGYTLTCYCHGAQFDISNGDVLAAPATQSLNTYPVKIEGKDIFVEI